MASESLQVRRRPTKTTLGDVQRSSSLVRASVLETALELGFGQNSTVADWIFNNPLSEEPEDLHPEPHNQVKLNTKSEPVPYAAEEITPTLTSGSNSTSDESSSLNSAGNNAPSAAVITAVQVHAHKPSVTESPYVHFGDFSSDQLQFSPFTLSPPDTRHEGTRGSSVGNLSGDTERSRSQDDGLHHNPRHESPSPGPADSTGYASEGQYLSKTKAGKGKDKAEKQKGRKNSKPRALDTSKTYEKDGEYASDGGYLSASSNKSQGKSPGKVKSRAMAFFRRRPKKASRASDDEDEDSIPPVPAIPTLPRPSSPKPLERRAAPSSPTRSGFSPLTLSLTNPPASRPGRRVSKSPPRRARTTPPQPSDYFSMARRPASPPVASVPVPTVLSPVPAAATAPLLPSMPGTPLSTASSSPSPQPVAGASKPLTVTSSRQHLSIPPPAPPPTLPLPQPPPSPSTLPVGMLPPLPPTPTTPSRNGAPTRLIPAVPTSPGSTRPLTPRRTASPFRPVLSPRVVPTAATHVCIGELPNGDQPSGREVNGRQRSVTDGLGSTPVFLQRKIQHGPSSSSHLSPSPTPGTRPRTPIGPSKFHEHFSSVSSVPLPQVLSTAASMSPSPSTATLSGSSSGVSLRSSHISSTSERSEEPANTPEYSRPPTSTSESSYGQPIASTFGRAAMNGYLKPRLSGRSDTSSSVYSSTTHRDNGSVNTFDGDADIDDDKSCADEDDDASVYPSDDKTAGRRTMYLVEHGEVDENGDEIVIAGSHYWSGHKVPPLPPLPPMPTRPGPGFF